jgi:hypothetical protein
MSEELIKQYESLMRQQKYREAGDIVLDNFRDSEELSNLAIKYHKKIMRSKDKANKDKYETETPGELIMIIDADKSGQI